MLNSLFTKEERKFEIRVGQVISMKGKHKLGILRMEKRRGWWGKQGGEGCLSYILWQNIFFR